MTAIDLTTPAVGTDLVVARFCAFRSVPSRGVAVLSMDIPLHQAFRALETLGTPKLGETIHVAFTRLHRDQEGPLAPPLHGTFEKFSMVAAREALNLSIEMPMEQTHNALLQLSIPTKASDIQVALVRLLNAPDRPAKPAKTHGQLAVTRCALRVKDEPFQRFILGPSFIPGEPLGNEAEAVAAVRTELGIESRRVLANDHEKLREWWAMEGRYEEWLQNGGLDVSVARDAR